MDESNTKNKKIKALLIDDEEVVREIGCEMLESLGISCIHAENGETGIRLYKENRHDVGFVILDVEMPGISGDKVYDILKNLNPDLHILVVSGYAKNHLETNYFKRKLDNSMYMPKPFQMSQLTFKIKSFIDI